MRIPGLFFILPLICSVWGLGHGGEYHQLLKQGSKFISPNGKFTVTYGFNPAYSDNILMFSETKTGHIYNSVPTFLCFALRWSPDSQSVVAVEGTHGGTFLGVIRLDKEKWKKFLPDSADIDVFDRTSVVHFRYIQKMLNIELVGYLKDFNSSDRRPHHYVVKLVVDPSKQVVFKYDKEEIGKESYNELLDTAEY